jgi:hypothetical protein
MGERRCNTKHLTSVLDGGKWSASCPSHFTPRYPLNRRLSGCQSQSEHSVEEKNSQPMPGFEPYHPINVIKNNAEILLHANK